MELLVLKIGGLTVFIKDIFSNQSIIKFNLINSDPEHDNIILDGMSLFTSIINDSSLKGNITINKHRTEAYGSVMFIDDPEQLFFGFQKLLKRGDIKMGYHKFDIKKS